MNSWLYFNAKFAKGSAAQIADSEKKSCFAIAKDHRQIDVKMEKHRLKDHEKNGLRFILKVKTHCC